MDYGKKSEFIGYDINTIFWNPDLGLMTTNGNNLSPTTILNHEADHALARFTNYNEWIDNIGEENVPYDNEEEKRVVTGSEQRTAKALGEISDGEVTREDHKGNSYRTESPTSTIIYGSGIIVTLKNTEDEK